MALDAILAPGLDGELAARLLELTSDVAAAVDRDGVVVQANPALVRAADIFRSLAGAAPNGVFAADARGEAAYVNERLAEILGRDGEEVLGFGWLDSLPDDERARLRDAERDGPVELRITRSDGEE